MGDCRYKRLDSIKLNNRTVFIDEEIKCISKKEVYKVIFDLEDKRQYILKAIYAEDIEAINTINFYMDDRHNYFMEMIDFYKDDTKTFLLLKYYQDGTLYTLKNPTPNQRDNLISDILEIGCYLHKKGYIHGDIKPDNFFIDKDKVRVGDLESIVKLDDIYNDTIDTLSGTQGFKYSHKHTYTLQDEIFAYIATIYYIEMGELLMTKEEFVELIQEDNPFDAINDFARGQINYISRENIRNFLLDIMDDLENNQKIDCCSMQEHFELTKETTSTPQEKEDVDLNPQDKETTDFTKTKKWKKPLLFIVGGVSIISALTLFFIQPNSPTCQKAFFIDEQTIKIIQKNGDRDFYSYKDGEFTVINDERVSELIDRENLNWNSQGLHIECRDGRVRVF